MATINELFNDQKNALNEEYTTIKATENVDTTPEYYEFLITYNRFFALLDEYGEQKAETTSLNHFKKLLKDRWERIEKTNLAYPSAHDKPITRICQLIAIKTIHPLVTVSPNTVLMPTVKHTADIKEQNSTFSRRISIDNYPLNRIILDNRNSFTPSDDAKDLAVYPDSDKTLWDRIIQPHYFDDLIEGVYADLSELKTLFDQISQEFKTDATLKQRLAILNKISPVQLAHSLEQSESPDVYWLLLQLEGAKRNQFLETLIKDTDDNDDLYLFNLLQHAYQNFLYENRGQSLRHLSWAIKDRNNPIEKRLYDEIFKIGWYAAAGRNSVLIAEFIYRTAFFIANPEHEKNTTRCIELTRQINQRSWGHIIGGLFLCLVGAAVITTIVAASQAVTFPLAAFFAEKTVEIVGSIIAGFAILAGAGLAYRKPYNTFQTTADTLFKPAPVQSEKYERVNTEENGSALQPNK